MPGISYHLLILMGGLTVAGLAFVIALAVGPYGRRGVRATFGFISLVAFVGSVAWLVVYLGMIQQRRTIEERIAVLRSQAMASGTLACLERADEALQASCAQSLFASPGAISSAGIYTASRLDTMKAARRYSGPRAPQFDDAVAALERSLQEDPFGIAADILVRREGCTAQRCEALSLFANPAQLEANIRNKTFEANVARYTAAWAAPAAPSAPAGTAVSKTTPSGETRAPIPDKYDLPSSASIPPVSIMTDEPLQRAAPAPAAKDRPAASPQEAAAPAAQPASPPEQSEAPPAVQKKSAPRRPQQQNAPLQIAPQR